jgi:hypothetical protein
MTDLTEQWKKGELPDGYYYCKLILNNMKPSIERCKAHCIPMGVSADRGEAVLAEVPDYVEWQNMVNCACEEHEANKRLIEENAQLKELLKECKEIFDECFSPSAKHGELYKKIDEVLR